MGNAVNWFEIPAKNLDRAIDFYQNVFGVTFQRQNMGPGEMAMFSSNQEEYGASGALIQNEGYEPNVTGSLVYLNAGEDLAVPLNKVEEAGGKIVLPKTAIGKNGYIAHIIDCEGNKVALHSLK